MRTRGLPQAILPALLLFAALASPADPVRAATRRVGVDCAAIRDCLAASGPGDTVLVPAGTYVEVTDTLLVPGGPLHPVTVALEARNGVTLLAAPEAAPGSVVLGSGGDPERIGLRLAPGVTGFRVAGVLFRDFATAVLAGEGSSLSIALVRIEGGCRGLALLGALADVADLEVEAAGCEAIYAEGASGEIARAAIRAAGTGVYDAGSPALSLADCAIWDGTGDAVVMDHGSALAVSAATLVGNAGDGVRARDGSLGSLASTIVAKNAGGGVRLETGGGVQVSCSDVWANAGGNYPGFPVDPTGTGGNVSKNPLFCDPLDVWPAFCANGLPFEGAGACAAIGVALGSCAACEDVPVRARSWGTVKAMYASPRGASGARGEGRPR